MFICFLQSTTMLNQPDELISSIEPFYFFEQPLNGIFSYAFLAEKIRLYFMELRNIVKKTLLMFVTKG